MNLHVEYQKGDFRNARGLFFSKNQISRITDLISTVVVFAGLSLMVISLINDYYKFYSDEYRISSQLAVIFIAIMAVLSFFQKIKYLPGPVDFEITNEGIVQKTGSKIVQKNWSEFSNYAYDDKMLVMLYPSYYYMALPKHSMSDNEWNELLTMVKTNIKIS